MGKKGSAPPPPDYQALAQQQQQMGMTGQQGYLGGSGQWMKDPNSPGGYTYKNTLGQGSQGVVNNAMGALGKPLDLSAGALTAQSMDLYNQQMQPQFQQEQNRVDQQLANRGIPMGSDAWKAAQQQIKDNQDRQRNQFLMQSRGQEAGINLQGRQQNLQDIGSILGFEQAGRQNSQAPDLLGAAGQGYANQLAYAQSQNQNSWMNQIIPAASTIGAAGIMASDIRFKENIQKIGETKGGSGIFLFSYKDDPQKQTRMGYMAQDVEKRTPEAVLTDGKGMKYVNLARVR